MSEYFVLPLNLLGIAAVLIACSKLYESVFGKRRQHRCSFCMRLHSEVAKLIEGPDAYICNKCVKTCSDVLMKDCTEYRDSFRDAGKNAGPSGGHAMAAGNPASTEPPPPVT